MSSRCTRVEKASELPALWDSLCDCYFQTREFLTYLETYNPCKQRYYFLGDHDSLKAGAMVYSLKINLLTFLNIPSPLPMQVISLPVSLSPPGLIGNHHDIQCLVEEVLQREKGIILGLNHITSLRLNNIPELRTLPTLVLNHACENWESYRGQLTSRYKRRARIITESFSSVEYKESDCSRFSQVHYQQYLAVMKKSTTKLETLGMDFFLNLPSTFVLGSYYSGENLLCWHLTYPDVKRLYFLFNGIDYALRDDFQSYYNNLFGVLKLGIARQYNCIDFGQTAETAKKKLGANPEERKLFITHHQPLVRLLLKNLGFLLTYESRTPVTHVFKNIR